ncbi:hypothetical protein K440DRAFT_619688 [Wilcoxina mikolae CBS 423.85]|nr:hypothetical protein K440DRAFT_619688 [Wilcoxina mikolae CBS 423.85]
MGVFTGIIVKLHPSFYSGEEEEVEADVIFGEGSDEEGDESGSKDKEDEDES